MSQNVASMTTLNDSNYKEGMPTTAKKAVRQAIAQVSPKPIREPIKARKKQNKKRVTQTQKRKRKHKSA